MIVPRFEIRRRGLRFFFVMIGKNGKTIARGLPLWSRGACRNAIRALTEAIGGYSAELAIVDTTEAR